MHEPGKCWEYLAAREDDELDRATRNLPAWVRPAHRILLDVMLQYCCPIDNAPPADESSG